MKPPLLIGLAVVWIAASAAAADEADTYIREPVRLQQTFTHAAGSCTYRLDIAGTINVKPGQENAPAPELDPNVRVMARAVCPSVESLKSTTAALAPGPLTWRQLSQSLSERSMVVTVERGHECTYAGELRVVGSNVLMDRFDNQCRAI